jgi:hypothetical protein
MNAVLPLLYLRGLSTGDFGAALEQFPATTVSVDDQLNFLHEKPVDFLGKAVEHT